MLTIFFRLLIIYFLLLCCMKFVGKRQIGELDISELITTILLSELAAMPVSNSNIPISYAIIPILMLSSLEIIITCATTKFDFLKYVFNSRPSYLIKHGKLDQNELSKIRLSIDELLGELRLKDISDISQVEYAILEQNGQLSVFPKAQYRGLTPSDFNLQLSESGIAHPIVIDGTINKNALIGANRNEQWLEKTLHNKNLKLSDIFIFTIDDSGNEFLIKKQKGATK